MRAGKTYQVPFCMQWAQKGWCRHGDACKYDHGGAYVPQWETQRASRPTEEELSAFAEAAEEKREKREAREARERSRSPPRIAQLDEVPVAILRLEPAPPARTSLPPVFVIGMPKCGTTSLDKALRQAGWKPVHWRAAVGGEEKLVSKLVLQALCENRNPFAYLPEGTNAITQMDGLEWVQNAQKEWVVEGGFPQLSHLEELVHAADPTSLFILNTRDRKEWICSLRKWKKGGLHNRIVLADLPDLPSGKGDTDEELMKWVDDFELKALRLFHLSALGNRLLYFDISKESAGRELLEYLAVPEIIWGNFNASARHLPSTIPAAGASTQRQAHYEEAPSSSQAPAPQAPAPKALRPLSWLEQAAEEQTAARAAAPPQTFAQDDMRSEMAELEALGGIVHRDKRQLAALFDHSYKQAFEQLTVVEPRTKGRVGFLNDEAPTVFLLTSGHSRTQDQLRRACAAFESIGIKPIIIVGMDTEQPHIRIALRGFLTKHNCAHLTYLLLAFPQVKEHLAGARRHSSTADYFLLAEDSAAVNPDCTLKALRQVADTTGPSWVGMRAKPHKTGTSHQLLNRDGVLVPERRKGKTTYGTKLLILNEQVFRAARMLLWQSELDRFYDVNWKQMVVSGLVDLRAAWPPLVGMDVHYSLVAADYIDAEGITLRP
ncbi:MAG: zinc finger CCCH domain-containing protein [bacterium]|nr:zinc finger CCCH domain-containing protein [bacterium]